MIHARRILKDASVVALGQAATMAALFAQNIAIARLLGPKRYGGWVLIVAIFNFLSSFFSFRTSDALTAFWMDPRYDDVGRRETLLYSTLYTEFATRSLAAALGICTCLVWTMVPSGSQEITALGPVYICALTKVIGFVSPTWLSLVRAARRLRVFAFIPALQAWLGLAFVSCALFLTGVSITAVALALLSSEIIGLILRCATMPTQDYANARRGLLGPPSPRKLIAERAEHRAFWKMMGAGYVSSCLSSVMKESDVIIVSILGTPVLAAFYRVAKSLASTMQTAVATLNTVIVQDFVDALRARRLREIKRLLKRFAPALIVTVTIATLVAALFVDRFIDAVLGPAYRGSRVPFLYLLPGIAFATAFFWVQPLAVALQSSAQMLRIAILNFLVYLGILTASAPIVGPWAAALALSVAWIFGHVALLLSIWPNFNNACLLEEKRG